MTTDVRTDAPIKKTSTDINDGSADVIAGDVNIDDSDTNVASNDDSIGENNSSNANESEKIIIDEITVESINIGTQLKDKRLELGYDERHVATELKISIDQVRALENNQFTHFRSATFARGFLKSYCRFLNMENAEILSTFDNGQKEAESTIKPVDKVHRQTHLGDPIVIFISVIIVAVLMFLVFWWPSESTTNIVTRESDNQAAAVVEEERVVETNVSETDESNEVGSNSDAGTESATSVDTSISGAVVKKDTVEQTPVNTEKPKVETPVKPTPKVETPVVKAPVAKKPEVQTPKVQTVKVAEPTVQSNVVTGLSEETVAILKEAGVSPDDVVKATKEAPITPNAPAVDYLDDVEIAFREDCWAEIRDASGTILFSGVQAAGSILTLNGDAPYRVVLGYARGVASLKYKGELFDFTPFTRKDLARFELK